MAWPQSTAPEGNSKRRAHEKHRHGGKVGKRGLLCRYPPGERLFSAWHKFVVASGEELCREPGPGAGRLPNMLRVNGSGRRGTGLGWSKLRRWTLRQSRPNASQVPGGQGRVGPARFASKAKSAESI